MFVDYRLCLQRLEIKGNDPELQSGEAHDVIIKTCSQFSPIKPLMHKLEQN